MPTIAPIAVRVTATLASCLLAAGCAPDTDSPKPAAPVAAPTYVGTATCGECHEDALSAWRGSHHELAMQPANPETVLGDFSDTSFEYFGTTSRFYRRGDTYFVRTDNAAGDLQEFPIAYTFGAVPLQQYLVEFPGGRYQALSVAWDSRPAAEGGQRWFHLYPDEHVAHGDRLHWTGRDQNWNYMCAECHSTDLRKNYRPASDSYETTWSEVTVGCEGCHGPGSRHVEQARAGEFQGRAGLLVDLDDKGRAVWEMNPATGIAGRSEIRMQPPTQPEACGRCHSRRSQITEGYEFGRPLMDTHRPSLLEENLYFADGQILEEVYVYGSFLQSRMYQAGVSCTDCHDPHSAKLKTGGEPSNVCATCHLPSVFAQTSHHRHPPESVSCVDCHMASRDYMVVDGRRDHSFRIPRPDLSAETGSPNACNNCHDDRDAGWASLVVADWYEAPGRDHYGFALHAGRNAAGNPPLAAAIANDDYPGIARATALAALRPPYSQAVARTIREALQSGDPLIRFGALQALPGLQPEQQADLAGPLLADRVRAVRIEAARVVSPLRDLLHVRFEGAFQAASRERIESLNAIAERPESQINMATMAAESGDAVRAEAALKRALQFEPGSVGARVNLADLYRRTGRDADAEALLRAGIERDADEGIYHHSLGLLLVSRQDRETSLEELRLAASLQPDNARFAYVYAVALNSYGQPAAAIDYLYRVRDSFPGDFDVQWALVTMLRDQERNEEALDAASKLAEAYPGVPPLEGLLETL